MDQLSLYEALGFAASNDHSSLEEHVLKRAYRLKALALHPDKNGSEEAKVQFARLQQAWSVLGDPQRRAVYDKWGNIGLVLAEWLFGKQNEESTEDETAKDKDGHMLETIDSILDWKGARAHFIMVGMILWLCIIGLIKESFKLIVVGHVVGSLIGLYHLPKNKTSSIFVSSIVLPLLLWEYGLFRAASPYLTLLPIMIIGEILAWEPPKKRNRYEVLSQRFVYAAVLCAKMSGNLCWVIWPIMLAPLAVRLIDARIVRPVLAHIAAYIFASASFHLPMFFWKYLFILFAVIAAIFTTFVIPIGLFLVVKRLASQQSGSSTPSSCRQMLEILDCDNSSYCLVK